MSAGAQPSAQRRSEVTEADVVRAGRRRFLRGERLDMQAVAAETGIGRATIFRWFGDRDRFVSAVLWSLSGETLERELARPAAPGPDHVVEAMVRTLEAIGAHPHFGAFLARDPQRAIAILTGPASAVAGGFRDRLAELLGDECPGALSPELPADELAYAMVRLAESYLYADILTGRPAEVRRLRPLFHRLLEGS